MRRVASRRPVCSRPAGSESPRSGSAKKARRWPADNPDGSDSYTKANLILIRGLPGSGKSTLAKSLDAVHLEADMYFMDENGSYKFDPLLLKEAHNWCQKECEVHLKQGNNVVIANTFIKQWEMDAYRKLAGKYKAALSIRTCVGSFNNVHGVSAQSLKKMRQSWEP